ncbi:MAG: type II CAAX prenyl endopeptidase Rce1 family protein [Planctomycetaceae bacterium]
MTSPAAAAGRWQARLAIARRDLLEFVRDRRAMFITLVMPMAMYPLLALSSTLGIRTAMLELDRRAESHRLHFVFSGPDAAAFAGRVAEFLAGDRPRPDGWPESVTVRFADPDSAQLLIDEAAADAWLDLPAGSIARLDGEATLAIDVRLSTVRPPDRRVKESVLAVLRAVADEARLARLRRAGLPTSLIEPLRVGFTGDVPQGAATAVREILPSITAAVLVLLALLTATGAFYPAIDAVAGEKERGTIETLLIAPCPMFDVVAGKFLAVFAVTVATLAANAVSIALTSLVLGRFLPGGLAAGLLPGDVAACGLFTLVAYLGLAAVAAALCLTVTAAARSGKEAQNTLTPVVMLIAALAGAALLPGSEERRWLPLVPFAGHVTVARGMLAAFGGGETPAAMATAAARLPVALGMSIISSAAITWLLLAVTARLISDEEVLFRGPEEAASGSRRPHPRPVPSAWQGCAAVALGFTGLWYAQGVAPQAFVPAVLVQQAMAVLVPLTAIAWWQRVDAVRTFSLCRPGGSWAAAAAAILGATLVGSGLFVVGAAAALAAWQGRVSPEARQFAAAIVEFVRGGPILLAVLVLAVVPAVCEELFFRGWVLAAFRGGPSSGRRATLAVVAQAAAFAAFHLLPERMPQTFALGLVLGGLVLLTGSLLPAIVAHAAHNATPLLIVAAASANDLAAFDQTGGSLPPWSMMAAVGCLAVGGLLLAMTRRGSSEDDAWMRRCGGGSEQP